MVFMSGAIVRWHVASTAPITTCSFPSQQAANAMPSSFACPA
jgi:hypothetical protein